MCIQNKNNGSEVIGSKKYAMDQFILILTGPVMCTQNKNILERCLRIKSILSSFYFQRNLEMQINRDQMGITFTMQSSFYGSVNFVYSK